MCGIVGSLSFDSSDFIITEEYIEQMRETMIHRGPDGAGTWISKDKTIGLGHRRLSIIDLSEKAAQPMSNEDNSITLVFNGEIYNHGSIRKELESLKKYSWKTDHSDTEVVLRAYQEWGIKCLDHFRGMFAIALWDSNVDKLWLIRDRIGIKPLYYSIHNKRVVFASEIKAILEDPDQERVVNEQGVFDYLSFLTVPAPNTLFEGIKKIPGGTWVCFDSNGNKTEERYWDVLDNTIDLSQTSEEEISRNLLDELREAVNLRKVSDVDVGVFLSGGIDSSTNAALFSEDEKESIKTFSIGYQGDYESYKNELHFAKLVADKVGATYHEKLLTEQDLIEFLPLMVRLQDEPIGDPVCVPLFYVSKLARENNVTVCQVGEGADELFWGYPYWKKLLRIQNISETYIPKFFLRCIAFILNLLGLNKDWRYEAIKRVSRKQPIYRGAEPYTHEQKMLFLSRRMKKIFKNKSSWESIRNIHDKFLSKSSTRSNLDWMTYIDLNLRLPELLLMRVDKMSMGVSLEARVPFLDHKFVEYAMSIPTKLKTRKGELKSILKKSVRGLIPDEIIDREKQGFSAPINEWSNKSLGKFAERELINFSKQTDLLDQAYLKDFLSTDRHSETWPLLNLAMWWSIYIKPDK